MEKIFAIYDIKGDAIYVTFSEQSEADYTQIISDDVLIRTKDDVPIGMTILHASIYMKPNQSFCYNRLDMHDAINIPKSVLNTILTRITQLEKTVFHRKAAVLRSVDSYEEEKRQGTLKKIQSVDELFD